MKNNTGKKTLAHNALFSVIYRLLNILFPIVSAGYVARILTPEGIGRYADASNNVSYFVMLGSLGIQSYAIREIARRKENRESRDRFFSEMLVFNAILTCVAAVIFLLCFQFLGLFSHDRRMYLICAIAVALNFLNIDWFFQGTEDFRFIAVRSFVVKLLGLICIFLFIHEPDDLYVYALICVLTNGGHYLLNILRASRVVKFRLRNLALRPHMKSLLFLALCTISSELYARLDITMLGIMEEKPVVACYTYAQKIIFLTVTTVIAITAVFMPRLSFYYKNDRAKFQSLTKFGTDMMVFLSFPLSLGLLSVAYPLITLWLGEGYGDAVACLILLSLLIPLKCIGDLLCYQVMMCAGRESYLMKAYIVTVLINFSLNLLLIPRFSALGASAASLISEVISFAILFYAARRELSFAPDQRNIFVVLISTSVMTGAVLLLTKLCPIPAVQLFGGTALGALIFIGLNFLLKNTFVTEELLKLKSRSRE